MKNPGCLLETETEFFLKLLVWAAAWIILQNALSPYQCVWLLVVSLGPGQTAAKSK